MNAKLRIQIAGIVLIALASVPVYFISRSTHVIPTRPIVIYTSSISLENELEHLPVIMDNDSPFGAWEQYETIARRLRLTKPEIIKSSLISFCHSGQSYADVRAMILLRVAFECESGLLPPENNSMWVGGADMNAPVEYKFGRFRLGKFPDYFGKPYKPDEEFEWRLHNCTWRNL